MSSTTAADRLAGAAAVVTGATSGVGLATARAFVREGARVVLIARNEARLRDVARTLGARASTVACDLADAAAVGHAADRMLEMVGSPPDILVNNAGAFTLARVEAMAPPDFTRSVDTNLVAPFLLTRALLPAMRARAAGHIVMVGSIADRTVFPENAAYAASKHGLRALHEVLRLELRGSGVRATLVSPGPVDTPLWDPVDPDGREGFTRRADMLAVDAVADAIVYVVTRPKDTNVDELRLSRS